MELKDLSKAIENNECIAVEDPVEGTTFTDHLKLINSFWVVDNKVVKVKKIDVVNIDGKYFIQVNGEDVMTPIDPDNNLFVLKKLYTLPDTVIDTLINDFNISDPFRYSIINVYTMHMVKIEDIAPRLLRNIYPYVYTTMDFINGAYQLDVYTYFSSDVLIPRLIYTRRDINPASLSIKETYFLSEYCNSEKSEAILNHNRIFYKGEPIIFIDVDNCNYVFMNVLNKTHFIVGASDAYRIYSPGSIISDEFICVKYSDDNKYLFDYFFDTQENREKYDKDKLVSEYKYILALNGILDTAPIAILHEENIAHYPSIDIFK